MYHLGQLGMKHLLGGKERLQVLYEERQARVVEGGQFLVQFGVQQSERALGVLQLLLRLRDFRLLALLRALQSLEAVPLAVVIDQLPPALLDLFL